MTSRSDAAAGVDPRRDARFMGMALGLARRSLGRVWPNPAVGCVIVSPEGCVVGRGWTQPGGRPHAETEALSRCGDAARGATCYVSLEPCAHHGQTPPCADALVAAGVRRVVVALEDPDPRVDGGGIARLRQAGIAVETGLEAEAARVLNAGFIARITKRRPLVTLKLATTLDGRIASRTGASQWITGEPARARAHLLRAEHDAVMVGASTAAADDPALTCRLPGMADRAPVRIVMAGQAPLSPASKLVAGARAVPTWLVAAGPRADRAALETAGVAVITVAPDGERRPDVGATLAALAERGLTRLLVEGGSRLAASVIRAGVVDRVAWFRAPSIIGGDGLDAVAALGVDRPDAAPRFVRLALETLGDDTLETLVAKAHVS